METKKTFQGHLSAMAELSNVEVLNNKQLNKIKGGDIDPFAPIKM
jgi:bacteriocin-like protein